MRGLSIALLATGLPFSMCMKPPPSSCERPESYYYYEEQEVPLLLDSSRIALFAPAGPGDEAADALATVGIGLNDLESHAIPGWYLAPVPAEKADPCGVEAIVAALADSAAFDFVAPVFSGPQIITQDLLVTFNDDVSSGEAQEILDLLQAGTITHSGLGIYSVRSPSRSGFAVLEAASQLNEHPQVRFADPDRIITGGGY